MTDEKDIEILISYGYTKDQIIDAKLLPTNYLVFAFFRYMEQDMAKMSNPFRVSPFHVFFVEDEQPNAFASLKNGRYLIIIHDSVINHIGKFIYQRFKVLFDPKGIFNQLIYTHAKMQLPEFVFQLVTLYIYNHELAHLNQFKNKGVKKLLLQESSILESDESFDIDSHAMEIDADIFAATELSISLRAFWKEVPLGQRVVDLLQALIALTGAAIFWFWQTINGGWRDIYFLKNSHPHVLVRITYIIDCISTVLQETGESGKTLDKDSCQFETLNLIGKLSAMDNDPGLKDYLRMFQEHVEDFEVYSKEYLVPAAKKLPFLLQWNWPPGRR